MFVATIKCGNNVTKTDTNLHHQVASHVVNLMFINYVIDLILIPKIASVLLTRSLGLYIWLLQLR